jgi:hypothetical protein
LGTLADPFKKASEASPQEETKKDNKEEEKPPSQKHVKFVFLYAGFCTTLCWPLPIIGAISGLSSDWCHTQNRDRKMKKFP